MGNIGRVFIRDLKRLAKAPATWSVVLFLTILPSLYTWFNVAAFWGPYDNTGNLRVCVVNQDEGVDDKMLGHLDVGDQLVAQLQENDQLGWEFVTYDEAMEQVNSGQAYAAFIIPEDFSANIATLTTGDFVSPKLEYFVNEKSGPVAPKVTDTGANTLDTTINETFFATVSSTVADLLNERIDASLLKMEGARSEASTRMQDAIENIREARQSLAELKTAASDTAGKVDNAQSMLTGAQSDIDALSGDFEEISAAMGDVNSGLATFSAKMGTALDGSTSKLAAVVAHTSLAVSQTVGAITSAKQAIGQLEADVKVPEIDYADLIASLESFESLVDTIETDASSRADARDGGSSSAAASSGASRIDSEVAQKASELKQKVNAAISALEDAQRAKNDWSQLIASLDAAAAAAGDSGTDLDALVQKSLAEADAYRQTYSNDVSTKVSDGMAKISATSSGFGAALTGEKLVIDQTSGVLAQLETTLTFSEEALDKTDGIFAALETDLGTLKADLDMIGASSSLSDILGGDSIDAEKIADFMMAPTRIEAQELYAVDAYGSAMAPLFINLTLWIGVFMLMVIFRLEVDDEGIEGLTITQRTLGRGLLLAIIAACQAIVCCAGCLILGVQTASAPLFFVTAIVASFAYLGIQYTLSTSFQHVGKALCIILVFVQIPGATGLYPVEMTPDFFRMVYPLFPFTYGINAIRETICGFYGNAWITYMGILVAFLVGFIAVGIILRPYLANLNRMFAREIAESDIINGEAVQLPARRYRMSQIIAAFADREEYRVEVDARIERYMRLYPRLKQGAVFVGIAVPIVVTAVFTFLHVDKVIVLTSWLAWLALVVVYLITVDYLHDYLSHLVSLEGMSADQFRDAYAKRESLTEVKPISTNFNSSVTVLKSKMPEPQRSSKREGDR